MKKNILLLLYFFCTPLIAHTYQRPIVVVIPSYNNALWYEKNLDSIFAQEYDNFRIIYILDSPTDDTCQLVYDYVADEKYTDRITIIHNENRRGALANHFNAVHQCKDYEIIVQLDGDDWFENNNVLARINDAYNDPNVWMTYGQYQTYPKKKCGQCEPLPSGIIKRRAYREYKWVTSAPRTFYAGLFKHIKLQDLINDGEFFWTSCDFAFMMPMLEMAHGHVQFIKDILYIYNCKTPFNDYKRNLQKQRHNEYVIRARSKYEPIPFLSLKKENPCTKADIIICAQDPEKVRPLLMSLQNMMQNISTISVFYDDSNKKNYTDLCELFPLVSFIAVSAEKNMQQKFLHTIENMPSDYILLTSDSCALKDFIDLEQCVKWMNKTHAHAFFLSLGKNITQNNMLKNVQPQPLFVALSDTIFAWEFKHGAYDWANKHNFNMTLYHKKDIVHACQTLHFDTLKSFIHAWHKNQSDNNAVGLCFGQSKSVIISDKLIDPLQIFNLHNDMVAI